ncbi:cytochrome b/b6 domain-containing protein [Falsiroseomonas oryziterrae]|uniref:cytochrome b/b6 domain-containing protein n=1 Tax=Falsiroseomonas oryziterrae TaxID=2911368 RepID=UPI001F01B12A|nr:cytochrome b/b6 domain-containing protein [Roseomonas sp. NPKOSM-4]
MTDRAMMERGAVKVWDPWVRLTHWTIALLLPVSWWTAETARYDLHFLSGYAILALVLFRIAWGFVGSETARFGAFLKSPAEALRHLAHVGRRSAPVEIGHNAAGGWMVLALLLLLLLQAVAGLFADDLIFTRGPLARRVDAAWSSLATAVHLRAFWVVVAFAVLHVLAVAAYRVLLGRNLVRPMLTGVIMVPEGEAVRQPRLGNPVLAIVLLAASGGFVWWISTLRPASLF